MALRHTRRRYLAGLGAVGAAGLAGCAGSPVSLGDGSGGGGGSDGGDSALTAEPAGPPPDGVPTTGTPPLADAALPIPGSAGPLRKEVKDVVGKDSIPAVDDPSFVAPGDADFLQGGDPVFGVVVNGVARAYPQKVLVWHEIANDTVGGVPVTVSYCPLTGTAMGFYRGETTFGVSGDLLNNNLVMYDRATDSRWPQVLARAIRGEHRGRSLREFRVVWTTFGRWREVHPDAPVLSTDTGYARDYGRDPYGQYNPRKDYYANRNTLFPRLNDDDRLHPKDVVVGARVPANAGPPPYAAAWEKERLRTEGVVASDLGGTPHVAVHDPALDAGYVYANPDGLAVETTADGIRVDGATHPPDDLPLDGVLATDAMWFAWAGFYPDTNLYA
ncbi:MAG: DUF3179 domain-containing protein [Haloferacaceae archaeon]